MVSHSSKRRYDNSFREQKAEDTRDRILQALTDLLADPKLKLADLSVGRIAERAGVSGPTGYRHVRNREAMFEAFDGWFGGRMGAFDIPKDVDALAALPPQLFACYEEHAELIRASRTRNDVAQIGMKARRSRDKLMAEAIRIVAALYKDGVLKKPEGYAFDFPDLLAFHDAETPIENTLFTMHLKHRMRAFQGVFHANPDYALWYGWSEMKQDLVEIKAMDVELRRNHK